MWHECTQSWSRSWANTCSRSPLTLPATNCVARRPTAARHNTRGEPPVAAARGQDEGKGGISSPPRKVPRVATAAAAAGPLPPQLVPSNSGQVSPPQRLPRPCGPERGGHAVHHQPCHAGRQPVTEHAGCPGQRQARAAKARCTGEEGGGGREGVTGGRTRSRIKDLPWPWSRPGGWGPGRVQAARVQGFNMHTGHPIFVTMRSWPARGKKKKKGGSCQVGTQSTVFKLVCTFFKVCYS